MSLPETAIALPSLPIANEGARKKVGGLLDIGEAASHKKKILFCVRGTHPEKNWLPDYFAQVIDQTRDLYNADSYIIGAPGDYDYSQGVIEKCYGHVYNICGKTEPADFHFANMQIYW